MPSTFQGGWRSQVGQRGNGLACPTHCVVLQRVPDTKEKQQQGRFLKLPDGESSFPQLLGGEPCLLQLPCGEPSFLQFLY